MFIYELQNFIRVAECLNITKAANDLGISQSGLSKSIMGLEKELGIELFSRDKRTLRLTPAGVSFFAEANNFLINCKNIKNGIEPGNTPCGSLSVLYTIRAEQITDFMELFLKINQTCRTKYPGISIKLKRMNGYSTLANILSCKADVAFLMQSSAIVNDPNEQLHNFVIEQDIPLMAAISASNPLAQANSLSIEDIKESEFVLIETPGQSEDYRALYAFFNYYGYVPYIAHTATDYESLYMLVESGYGIALVPHSSNSKTYNNIKFIPLRMDQDNKKGMIAASYDLLMSYPKSDINPVLPLYLDIAKEVLGEKLS